jgi:apolipoprotein D and lipocalin family protein
MKAALQGTEPKRRHPHLGIAALALLIAGISVVGRRRPRRPIGNTRVPEPAKTVDLARYLGLWHEFARYENRFEKDCDGVTAAYSALPDGRLRIVNACRVGGLGGPLRVARARAKIVPGSGGAKLKVAFFGPFYFGDYWVLDHDDDYAWSIVGEPSGRYMWILTRAARPAGPLQTVLFGRARALGYDTTLLRLTHQPPED